MNAIEILEKIESGEFRHLGMGAGQYYVSRTGNIYSLNHAQPRRIDPAPKMTGELTIALYVPNLLSFSVAELVLTAFVRPPKPGEKPCYLNFDPRDVSLKNLEWGDEAKSVNWRAQRHISKSKKMAEVVSTSPEISDSKSVQYYCNRPFMSDLFSFSTQLNRALINVELTDIDESMIRRTINDITELTSVTVLNFKKFESVFSREFENEEISNVFSEHKRGLVKNRKNYANL
jgi:hypothetical protein